MTGGRERVNGARLAGAGAGAGEQSTAVHVGAELVILELAGRKPDDAIAELGGLLVANEHVERPYVAAAIERERVLPTGLPTAPVGVAVPHADPDHVLRPAIAVGRTTTPIPFAEMASPERTVEVRLVFLLALSSKQQAAMLSALVIAFQREGFLGSVLAAGTALEVASLVQSAIAADAAAPAVAGS